MITVTQSDIKNSAKELGIKAGDSVIIHSSLKSLGYVEGGPETIWPHIENEAVYPTLKEMGAVKETTCGNAKLICVETKEFTDFCMKVMEDVDERYLWDLEIYYDETLEWLRKIKELKGV